MISRGFFALFFSFLALSALILHILGSDLSRGCQNAINKVLRRRVIAKKYPKSRSVQDRLTMDDLLESLKIVQPMKTNNLSKKYEKWINVNR